MSERTPERTPEDALLETVDSIVAVDPEWEARARERLDRLTKPPGSLGVLEDVAARIAAIQQTVEPRLAKRRVIVMAADHGVTAEGVSPYPSEVTAQMVANFLSGGAAINQLARWAEADVTVVDMGVATDLGTRTSHWVILARSLSLPTVVGLNDITRVAEENQDALLYGRIGRIILDRYRMKR